MGLYLYGGKRNNVECSHNKLVFSVYKGGIIGEHGKNLKTFHYSLPIVKYSYEINDDDMF